jgi:NADH:ubiquinone oxidoreductase subunit 6 (subunit J)
MPCLLFLFNEQLKMLILNVDFVFFLLWLFIVMSLLANQLINLIYRLINLAILSLSIIALWSYYTDLTFIYIVYILAFVGAVVMLFLSVILMLPSSITSSFNKLSYALLFITDATHTELANSYFI